MLTKAIQSGKEHRKEYYDWRAVDITARNHGSDPWFRNNRLAQFRRAESKSKQDLKDFFRFGVWFLIPVWLKLSQNWFN